MIPYGRQEIDDEDVAAVVAALRSDWLTQGPTIEAFESDLALMTGAEHAVAYCNATAALHGACHAAELGPGDLLITSSLSFAASANCGRYVGADVGFVDIDPKTLNLDPAAVPEGVEALVPVHFAGLPVDLTQLVHRPRVIIEDAAHAIGATTPDGPVGNCAHSDMTVFSFHPVKTITTGEGGAVTTNNAHLAERLRRFRHHGIRAVPDRGGWYYEIDEIGMNYRLTDMQAALGRTQLAKLGGFISRRHELAQRYDLLLAGLPVTTAPAAGAGFTHGHHLYPIRVQHRDEVFSYLRQNGIGTQVHYVPIHHQPAYASSASSHLVNTNEAYEQILSLPLFPTLTEAEQDKVVDTLADALAKSAP